jgi:RNA recognition motif-containing protein
VNNKLYIGNLAYEVAEDDLKDFFSGVGEVTSCRIIRDRETGRSRGFGFVEMATEELANKALEEMNGKELQSRSLKVSIAKDRPQGGGGGGGRGGSFGGGGNRY